MKKNCRVFVEGDGGNTNPYLSDQEAHPTPSVTLGKRKKNILIKETCKEQEERIRNASPYGQLKSWKLFRFIVKSNDDVR